MQSEVLYFISRQHCAALTVKLSDSALYPAVLHVAHKDDPFRLFFLTDRKSTKVNCLPKEKSVCAAVVLGFSEKEFTTLQMTGCIKEVAKDELEEARMLYLLKFPQKKPFIKKKSKVLIEFIPSWWKYTDYATTPKTIFSSS